jgi:hypothetical protein
MPTRAAASKNVDGPNPLNAPPIELANRAHVNVALASEYFK